MRPGASVTSAACGLDTDKPPNTQVLSDEATVPESTSSESRLDSVVRYFLGLASTRDVGIVSRILHSLDAAEEQALVLAYMSAQADDAVLTPALAGRSGSGKRCTSWPLVVRRAHASRFHQWCQSRDVNILQNRLPYGIMIFQRTRPVARVLEHVDHAPGARAGTRTLALQRICQR